MNDADTLNLRIMWSFWLIGLAVQKNLTVVGLVYAS